MTREVLHALEPVGLELCLQAAQDVQRERDRLTQHWQQKRERAHYESQQAERRYRAVDPENRLVARALEQQWNEALRQERQVEEAFEQFRREKPAGLTTTELARIRSLSEDIPALWQASDTTMVDRKEIIRALLDRVVVDVRDVTDQVEVALHWKGGSVTRHGLRRTVASYDRLQDYDRLKERVVHGNPRRKRVLPHF